MINDFFLEKSDIVNVQSDSTTMSSTNPDFVTNLLNGVSSQSELIDAIENYNDTNKLPLNKRIKYSICVGSMYISVAKAVKKSTNYIITGYDYTGAAGFEYSADGKITNGEASMSTHIIKADDIKDVVIKGYDRTVIDPIRNYKTNDTITEKELISQLKEFDENTYSNLTTGQFRNYIIAFCYGFKKYRFNDYDYSLKPSAYNLYLKILSKYFLLIKDICVEFESNKDEKSKNKFVIISDDYVNEETFKAILKQMIADEKEISITDVKDYEVDNKYQMTFGANELEVFKKCIDFEHLKFDGNGQPIWD